uniref:Nose resistant-to-fluoxetine protein N-terminal domain-containing protein n=1 Tax=Anopheles albimanus TaxID=7167 RepID=A0A182FJF5_ANOAL
VATVNDNDEDEDANNDDNDDDDDEEEDARGRTSSRRKGQTAGGRRLVQLSKRNKRLPKPVTDEAAPTEQPPEAGGLLETLGEFVRAARAKTVGSFETNVLRWMDRFGEPPEVATPPPASWLAELLSSSKRWFEAAESSEEEIRLRPHQRGADEPDDDDDEAAADDDAAAAPKQKKKKNTKEKKDSLLVELLNESPLTALFSEDELPVEQPIETGAKRSQSRGATGASKVVKERIPISAEDFEQLLLRVPSFVPDYSRVAAGSECQRQGRIFERQLRGKRLWALKMIDASAKLSAGMLRGNAHQLGDYDQCTGIATKVRVQEDEQVRIRGKYCLAHIDVVADDDELQLPVHLLHGRGFLKSTLNDPDHFLPRFTTINWGICLPAACTFEDAGSIVRGFVRPYNSTGVKVFLELEEGNCHVRPVRHGRTLPLKGNWVLMAVIGFYTFVAVVTLVATLNDYEIFIKIDPPSASVVDGDGGGPDALAQPTNALHQTLMAFSLKQTLRQLGTIAGGEPDPERPTIRFRCLDGLKGVASVALFAALRLVPLGFQPFTNRNEFTETLNAPWSVTVRLLMLYADVFLVVSGFLTAYHTLREYRVRARVAWFKRILGRYLRLCFPLLPVVGFYALIWEHLGSGPQWGDVVVKNANLCKQRYLSNLLFVQNWYPIEETCAPHTFQLAIEMQLSVLAPFLMIVLVRSPFYGTAAYVLLHCLSTAIRFSATAEDRLAPYVYHGVRLTQLYRTLNLSTTETLHRLTPYLAGFGLGYLMQDTEPAPEAGGPRSRPERGVRWAGWLGAGVALLWCLLTPLDIVRSDFQYEPASAAQYAALAPLAWSLGLCWLIYYCISEETSLANRLLSSRPLVLLGHLSYSLSLVQFLVFFYFVGTTRGSETFSLATYFNRTEVCLLLGGALALTLLFDLPIQNVKRLLDGAGVLDALETAATDVKEKEPVTVDGESTAATEQQDSSSSSEEPINSVAAAEEETEDFWANSGSDERSLDVAEPAMPASGDDVTAADTKKNDPLVQLAPEEQETEEKEQRETADVKPTTSPCSERFSQQCGSMQMWERPAVHSRSWLNLLLLG